jgi:hypothetical protein
MAPVELFSVRPAGRVPALTLQENGAIPPELVRVAL